MKKEEMLRLTDFIYDNYPDIKGSLLRGELTNILEDNEDKVVSVKENGEFLGAAIYLRLENESMEKLVSGKLDLTKPEVYEEVLGEMGNHIHFVCVLADGSGTILKGLKEVINKYNPETLTWYTPDMKRFRSVTES